MSAPPVILDNLPSLCQNCQIWWKFDVVIPKIILLVFLRHGVLMTNRKLHMRFRLTPRLMTLDDNELYMFKFSQNFADFGRNNS